MGLTIKQIENAKPRARKYKLADGVGRCLIVKPSGAKLWLWRYRFDNAEKNMSFGQHPLVTFRDARERHFAAKKLLATGINPMAERRAEAEAKRQEAKALQREVSNSFENVASKWWEWWSIGKSPRHADTVGRRLESDVFPAFDHKFIDEVTAADVSGRMFAIERRDARDVAKRRMKRPHKFFAMQLLATSQAETPLRTSKT
jgi:hypothetical protein